MMQNVPHTTNTVGAIRSTRILLNGQADTKQYSDAEKPVLFKQRENKQLGQDWDNPSIGNILLQNNEQE